jgi:DNA modification methylase
MLLLPEMSLTTRDAVHHCSASVLLNALPDASVSLIATDPPYGIGYESSWTTRSDGTPRETKGSFGADVFNASWLPQAARVLKTGGALYLFTRWDVAHLWKAAIEAAGLDVVQRIVWDKKHWGTGDLRYYGSQTEDILFCTKGEHNLNWRKRSGNVWRIWRGRVWEDGNADNPTQKPEQLMRKIIELSSRADDTVLDPFVGSGTTAAAARSLGRHYIACDVSAYQVSIARKRLAKDYTLPMLELAV